MINILKEGKPGRKVRTIYTHKCATCGCVFEYDKDYVDVAPFGTPAIECPCCHLHTVAYNDESRIEEIK